MGRIRTIRPEFWTDGKVVELSFAARLLFIGTWNFALCRDGHLDDDPRGLQLKILPADNVDGHALVEELVTSGLLQRGEHLTIVNFEKHQKTDIRWQPRCPYCIPAGQSPATASHGVLRRGTEENAIGVGKGKGKGKGIESKTYVTSKPDVTPEGFDDFWGSYPRRNGKRLNRAKSERAWMRLSQAKRDRALAGATHYRQACDGGVTIAKDAFRWLRDDEFEDWQTPAETAEAQVAPRPSYHSDWKSQDEPKPRTEEEKVRTLELIQGIKNSLRESG